MNEQIIEKQKQLIVSQKEMINVLKERIKLQEIILEKQIKLIKVVPPPFMKAYPRWLNNLIFFMAGIGFYGVLIHYLL
jgi:hypothetical protein